MASEGSSYEWAGLLPVIRRVELSFTIENVEPLRIGAGRGDVLGAAVDLPVYRQRVITRGGVVEEPIIPGSSLKGVLRTIVVAVSRSCNMPAHDGVQKSSCVDACFGSSSDFDNWRRQATPDAIRKLVAGFCPACILFGAPSLSSRVTVSDFVPVNPPVRTGIKTGVGINRRTGAAQPRALYNVEYVEPGERFSGSIVAVNTPNWLLSLLFYSIELLGSGWFKLGGFKSRGMGAVRVLEDGMTLRISVMKPARSGKPVLEALDGDIDEEISLEGCTVTGTAFSTVMSCEGETAVKAFKHIAGLWPEVYCEKAGRIHASRHQNTISTCPGQA